MVLVQQAHKSTVGVVLLSKNNYYLDKDGNLPKRPYGDKANLRFLMQDRLCIGSTNTVNDLPPSMLFAGRDVQDAELEEIYSDWQVNLGIKTFKLFPPDIFIISRGPDVLKEGKQFDIKWFKINFVCLWMTNEVELWIRKDRI